jgi:hypothetical protein
MFIHNYRNLRDVALYILFLRFEKTSNEYFYASQISDGSVETGFNYTKFLSKNFDHYERIFK